MNFLVRMPISYLLTLLMHCVRPFNFFSSSFFFFFFFFFLISTVARSYASEVDAYYTNCSHPFLCGNSPTAPFINATYPFWGNSRPKYCGLAGFQLDCVDNEYAFMDFDGQRYRVLGITRKPATEPLVMTVARNDLWNTPCLQDQYLKNTSMDNNTLFHYSPGVKNLSIFYCSSPSTRLLALPNNISCPLDGHPKRFALFFGDPDLDTACEDYPEIRSCEPMIKVPMGASTLNELKKGTTLDLHDALERGFDLAHAVGSVCTGCESSGGVCGTNSSYPNNFVCYCSDEPHPYNCSDSEKSKSTGMKIGIGVAVGVAATASISIAIFLLYCRRNKKKPAHSYVVSRSMSSAFSSRTDFEKGSQYYGLPIFEYEELREATNNFDPQKELGDGGFGSVFYGKLQDGRKVAVKRLYENNYKRVEQFMNEVEILAHLRHPNLVQLYGCTSKQSHRLILVYEYVANGTVADHLHGDRAKAGSMPWSTRLNIAVETASALVYLHASDIIHRDVKTNNILLDENYSVKVADFGLSRLFPFNVTHVSTAPQGTPGYVDPEYHQCYQLTEKSDVYSFGVVLMELISSLPAVDITRHRHEINLSNLAINKIQGHALHELVDANLGFDSNYDTKRMITAVAELGFQCLQNEKEMRPSMVEVLETLKNIQKQDDDGDDKAEERDHTILLKDNPLMLSPDSVTIKWVSTTTTPNASG